MEFLPNLLMVNKNPAIHVLGPVTLIINQMLNTGIFPDKMKIAKIIPIHKKGDETLFTNYAISKMFQGIISVFPRTKIVL